MTFGNKAIKKAADWGSMTQRIFKIDSNFDKKEKLEKKLS
jgi:hypothetical protein